MKISIIIPAYNEGKTVSEVLSKVCKVQLTNEKELIVINDGSTDDTLEKIKEFQAKKHIKIINNETNLGKGKSIVKALKLVSGNVVLIQDADLEYDPKDIPKIIRMFDDKNVQVVYGSRILENNPISHWTFSFGGRLLTTITNVLYRTNITDEATGYKAFRVAVLSKLNLKSKGFEFCPEVTAKVAKLGIKIYEVPISYSPRPIKEKKIKWWDGALAIYYLFKYRFFR